MTELTRSGIWASLKEERSPEGNKVPPVQRPGPPHLHLGETMGYIPKGFRKDTLALCWPLSPSLTDGGVMDEHCVTPQGGTAMSY